MMDHAKARKFAESRGLTLGPDAINILAAISRANGKCPCAHDDGLEHCCPCVEVKDVGTTLKSCTCGLFTVKED